MPKQLLQYTSSFAKISFVELRRTIAVKINFGTDFLMFLNIHVRKNFENISFRKYINHII